MIIDMGMKWVLFKTRGLFFQAHPGQIPGYRATLAAVRK
jgi:hypothetical protein